MRKDKEIAIKLRKQGKSYNEISKVLGIPKSTLSGWFKDLRFSNSIKIKLISETKEKWARNITNYNKKRAQAILEKAKKIQDIESKKIKNITDKELWLLGTALYWAEGTKRERWKVRFTNSDPDMIRFMMCYFRNICNIEEEKFRLTLQIHPNISEEEAKRYWRNVTKLPSSQFYKTLVAISKASKKKREPRRLPYGTLNISISDVNAVNRIKGWLKGLTQVV
ncbi:MAG: helix-turn-helix domain-containing protein [Candidatus Omnitrophica bacterium]|nr:helix-turn-helix domain-containing protein [Candidatus Omnitrophota bacterium]